MDRSVQEAHRIAGSDGVVASTPRSEALNWTCGGQVNRYSSIMEGQSWLSPPLRLKTPEMVSGLSARRPKPGWSGTD